MAEQTNPAKPCRITLIMPVRNEADSVEETLGSLVEGTRLPEEIIIADGRSSDGTVEKIKAFSARHPDVVIKVVDNEKLWAGSARNRAVENSTGDIILMADFGNRFRPNWVEAMARPFLNDPDTDVVCGLFQPKVETDFHHCVAVIHMLEEYMLPTIPPEELEGLLPEVVVPVGMATGITRTAWDEVDGFPEWLFKGQDKCFGRKAWALGLKIVVAWDALVDHHVRSSLGELFMHQFRYGRGFGQQRLISNMTAKHMMIYGLMLLLFVAGFSWPPFWAGAGLLLVAHLWHFGLRRQFKQTIHPWKWKYLYMIPLVVLARDTGYMLGHIVGWAQWYTRPELRQRYHEYLKGVDPARLRIVSK
ncbi:MAG: glycosyltransferase [Rhodobacteraceae bacterium]|nr:glycosyltransferase [Paracoccaceae bacterium]